MLSKVPQVSRGSGHHFQFKKSPEVLGPGLGIFIVFSGIIVTEQSLIPKSQRAKRPASSGCGAAIIAAWMLVGLVVDHAVDDDGPHTPAELFKAEWNSQI